jgi:hypothetical protein
MPAQYNFRGRRCCIGHHPGELLQSGGQKNGAFLVDRQKRTSSAQSAPRNASVARRQKARSVRLAVSVSQKKKRLRTRSQASVPGIVRSLLHLEILYRKQIRGSMRDHVWSRSGRTNWTMDGLLSPGRVRARDRWPDALYPRPQLKGVLAHPRLGRRADDGWDPSFAPSLPVCRTLQTSPHPSPSPYFTLVPGGFSAPVFGYPACPFVLPSDTSG